MDNIQIQSTKKTVLLEGYEITTFEVPPADFDPITAEPDELALYGIPRRPNKINEPEAYERWHKIFSKKLRYVIPEFTTSPHKRNRHFPDNIQEVENGAYTADTWSGVFVQSPVNDPFKFITGNWIVPAAMELPNQEKQREYLVAAWVGIDGLSVREKHLIGGSEVLQAGTQSYYVLLQDGLTQEKSFAFVEWWPLPSVIVPNFMVNTGDYIEYAIEVTSETSATVIFTNITQGVFASHSLNAEKAKKLVGNCAEWIIEDPGYSSTAPLPFPYYSATLFNDCYAQTKSGLPVDSGSGNIINMVKANRLISKVNIMGKNSIWFIDVGGDFLGVQRSGSSPALVVYNDILWVAFLSSDGQYVILLCNSINPSVSQSWSDDIAIPGQNSAGNVAMAEFNGQLWLGFTTTNRDRQLLVCQYPTLATSSLWSQNYPVSNQASGRDCALASFNGFLWIAFVANNPGQDILLCFSDNPSDPNSWSTDYQVQVAGVPQSSANDPALAVFRGKLWLAFADNNYNLFVYGSADPSNPASWQGGQVAGFLASGSPSLTVFDAGNGEALWVGLANPAGDIILCYSATPADAASWSTFYPVMGQTCKYNPSLAVYNDGTGEKLWVAFVAGDADSGTNDLLICGSPDPRDPNLWVGFDNTQV